MVTNKIMNSNSNEMSTADSESESKFDPAVLGREFVRQFYTMLHKAPENLFRFYSRDSWMIYGNTQNETVEPIKGFDAIHKKILSLNFKDCHTKICQVDSLESTLGNVIIQVVGELSNNGLPMRRFFQTFVLCRRSINQYYVKNDIFRYQDEGFPIEESFEEKLGESQVNNIDSMPNEISSLNEVSVSSLGSNNASSIGQSVPVAEIATALSNSALNDLSNVSTNGTLSNSVGANILNSSITNALDSFAQQQPTSQHNVQTSVISTETITSSSNLPENDAQLYFSKPTESTVETVTNEEIENDDVTSSNVDRVPNNSFQDIMDEVDNNMKEELANEAQAEKSYGGVSSYANMVLRTSKSEHTGFVHPEPAPAVKVQSFAKLSEISTNGNSSFDEPIKSKERTERPPSPNGGDNFYNNYTGNENGFGSDLSNKRSPQHSDDQQIFVGNLPQSIGEEQLTEFFNTYGTVVEVRINRANQKGGKTPNYGFVTFKSRDDVKNILSKKPIHFNEHRINVEEKRAQARGFGNSNGYGRNNPGRGYGNMNGISGGGGNQYGGFGPRGGQREGRDQREQRDLDRNGRSFNPDKRNKSGMNNSGGNRLSNNNNTNNSNTNTFNRR